MEYVSKALACNASPLTVVFKTTKLDGERGGKDGEESREVVRNRGAPHRVYAGGCRSDPVARSL